MSKPSRLFSKETIVQAVKFGLVGVMNTLITLAVIFILMKVFHLSYKWSNVIGYIIGLINSFIWNKKWTFKSTGNSIRELLVFAAVFGVCYGLQFLFLLFLVEQRGISEDWAQPLAMILYTGLNFLLNKLLTFKK